MESAPNSRWWRELSRGCLDVAQLSVEGMERMDGSWILDSWLGTEIRIGKFLLSMKDLWIYICYVILMKGSIHRSVPMEKVSFSSVDFFLTE